jgi:hypothetical protein
MTFDYVFSQLPDLRSHSFPDYSIPKGDPVIPVALTSVELSTILELYKTFTAVDPTDWEELQLAGDAVDE